MKRLFFALWPDDLCKQRCAGIINSIRHDAGKPMPMENVHVTLVFLGNLEESQQLGLQATAEQLKVPEITINFNRLSFWKKPGILCLTSSETCAELRQVVHDLTLEAQKLNIKVDGRPFKPHVTLFRDARKLNKVSFAPVIWHSHAICLAQSHAMPGQSSRYEIIEQWPAT